MSEVMLWLAAFFLSLPMVIAVVLTIKPESKRAKKDSAPYGLNEKYHTLESGLPSGGARATEITPFAGNIKIA